VKGEPQQQKRGRNLKRSITVDETRDIGGTFGCETDLKRRVGRMAKGARQNLLLV